MLSLASLVSSWHDVAAALSLSRTGCPDAAQAQLPPISLPHIAEKELGSQSNPPPPLAPPVAPLPLPLPPLPLPLPLALAPFPVVVLGAAPTASKSKKSFVEKKEEKSSTGGGADAALLPFDVPFAPAPLPLPEKPLGNPTPSASTVEGKESSEEKFIDEEGPASLLLLLLALLAEPPSAALRDSTPLAGLLSPAPGVGADSIPPVGVGADGITGVVLIAFEALVLFLRARESFDPPGVPPPAPAAAPPFFFPPPLAPLPPAALGAPGGSAAPCLGVLGGRLFAGEPGMPPC